jgi:hypothetical protein
LAIDAEARFKAGLPDGIFLHTKNPNLEGFGTENIGTFYFLRPLDTFYGQKVYFVAVW